MHYVAVVRKEEVVDGDEVAKEGDWVVAGEQQWRA